MFKIAAIALMLAGSFSSCTKKENNVDTQLGDVDTVSIIGKWKLVKTSYPMSGKSSDYSKCNIVFEFKSDHLLTISGEPVHLRPHFSIDPDECEYFYSFVDDENGYGMVGLNFGLKIDRYNIFWYRISSKELEISQAPVDGGIYNLIKIN